jgi:hypothetical protein
VLNLRQNTPEASSGGVAAEADELPGTFMKEGRPRDNNHASCGVIMLWFFNQDSAIELID